ncbi:MAG: hypothetical protein LBV69_04145 [Bacteroidales bacterium]|jgi:hypothetical protein|nr:hypothetical protein [Bacteroidales bacterium]
MKFDKEFKEAISHLDSKEKDKLILRLQKKDIDLANRLYFELVSGDSIQNRSEIAIKSIQKYFSDLRISGSYFSPGIFSMYFRKCIGMITEHVKITQDKYGEIVLNIMVISYFSEICNKYIEKHNFNESYNFNKYFVAKIFKLMILIKKIDEDYFIDFEDGLEKIGNLIEKSLQLKRVAIENGLDVNWLIFKNIPDNIVEIEKDLRQRVSLKS